MSIHSLGGSITSKKRGGLGSGWKPLLLPEIPATRFSCFLGSLRPKIGLCILLVICVTALCFACLHFIGSGPQSSSSLFSAAPRFRMASALAEEAVRTVSASNSEFTKNLYAKLKDGKENVVMSGYSLMSVMSMAYAGAKSSTYEQIKAGLSLPKDEHVLFEGLNEVNRVTKSTENFTLETANSIFIHEEFEIVPEFLEKIKTKPQSVDYSEPETARSIINDWVEDKTRSKIRNLLPAGTVTPMTRLVLVNAIYFKGDWARKFSKEETREEEFFVSESKTVKVPMMHAVNVEFRISKDLGSTILELPYKGDRLSMFILLPDEKFGLNEIKIENFDFLKLKQQKQKIKLTLPKFKIESTHNLVPILKDLGMTDMFEHSRADFSGISGKPHDLAVSSVVQKAVIEVNEEGSEAAAASGIVMMMRSMPLPPANIKVNHPFMFFIKDKLTGMILFSGRVTDPSI